MATALAPSQLCRDVNVNAGSVGGVPFDSTACYGPPKSQARAENNAACNISIYAGIRGRLVTELSR